MKTAILGVLFVATASFALNTARIRMLPGEHWWAGVISDSHRMPLTAESTYQFDFEDNTAGNQGQPLLLSDKGRFLWCPQPFSFRIEGGEIWAESKSAAIHTGSQDSTLREVFRHVSERYFPTDGKTPHEALFLHPQYNTWIELTYNQNQKDILAYARSVVADRFPRGVLMIDEGWFSHYGNLEFDRGRFPDPPNHDA